MDTIDIGTMNEMERIAELELAFSKRQPSLATILDESTSSISDSDLIHGSKEKSYSIERDLQATGSSVHSSFDIHFLDLDKLMERENEVGDDDLCDQDFLEQLSDRCPSYYRGYKSDYLNPCSTESIDSDTIITEDLSDTDDQSFVDDMACSIYDERLIDSANVEWGSVDIWNVWHTRIINMKLSLSVGTKIADEFIENILEISREIHKLLATIRWESCPFRSTVQLVIDELYKLHIKFIKINDSCFQHLMDTEYGTLMVSSFKPQVVCLGCQKSDYFVLYKGNRWKLSLAIWIDFLTVLINKWWFVREIREGCNELISSTNGVERLMYQQDMKAIKNLDESLKSAPIISPTPEFRFSKNHEGVRSVGGTYDILLSTDEEVAFIMTDKSSKKVLNPYVTQCGPTFSSNDLFTLSSDSESDCCREDLLFARDKQICELSSIRSFPLCDGSDESAVATSGVKRKFGLSEGGDSSLTVCSASDRFDEINELIHSKPIPSFSVMSDATSRYALVASIDSKSTYSKGTYEHVLDDFFCHAVDQARMLFKHENATMGCYVRSNTKTSGISIAKKDSAYNKIPELKIEDLMRRTIADDRNNIFNELIENQYILRLTGGFDSTLREEGSVDEGSYSNINVEITEIDRIETLQEVAWPYALLSVIALHLADGDHYEQIFGHLTDDNKLIEIIEYVIAAAETFSVFRRKIKCGDTKDKLLLKHKRLISRNPMRHIVGNSR